MIWISTFAGGLLVAAIVGALCLPVWFRLALETEPKLSITGHVSPLAGLAPAIRLFDTGKPKSTKRQPAERDNGRRKARRARPRFSWSDANVIAAIVRLVMAFIRSCRLRSLQGDLVVGFEDPADTGAVFGTLAPLVYGCPNGFLNIRPDFATAGLRGSASVSFSFVPLDLLPAMVGVMRTMMAKRKS